jgi:hypothetical protein
VIVLQLLLIIHPRSRSQTATKTDLVGIVQVNIVGYVLEIQFPEPRQTPQISWFVKIARSTVTQLTLEALNVYSALNFRLEQIISLWVDVMYVLPDSFSTRFQSHAKCVPSILLTHMIAFIARNAVCFMSLITTAQDVTSVCMEKFGKTTAILCLVIFVPMGITFSTVNVHHVLRKQVSATPDTTSTHV